MYSVYPLSQPHVVPIDQDLRSQPCDAWSFLPWRRYEDWMKSFLRSCGPRCRGVQLLPAYDLTQVG